MTLLGFVTVIHVLVALFIILVVLLQGGNSGGVGAALGGGNSSGFFGATGGNKFFQRLTYGAAGMFMVTSVFLTVRTASAGKVGLAEKLEREAAKKAQTQPVGATTAPTDAASQPDAEKPADQAPATDGSPASK